MRKIMLLSICVACAISQDTFKLGVIEVVSNEGGARNTDANVVSIYSDDFEKNDIKNVSSLAKTTAGIYTEKRGGRAEQNIIVRGFNSRRVPVFIDGIPVYIPYDGNMDLSRFSTFDLSRIDISKGSSSVLYGSNTMGGAINLVSKKPSKELEGSVGYGFKFGKDSGTFGNDVSFNLGTKQELFYIQTGASYVYNKGDQLSGNFTQSNISDEDGKKRDNSSRKDKKISFKIGFTPNQTDEYVISFATQKASKEQPFYAGKYLNSMKRYWNWPKWDKDSIYFLSHTDFNKFYINTKAFYDTFKNDLSSYDDKNLNTQKSRKAFNSHYKDRSFGFGLEVGGDIGDKNTLKFATNYKYDVHKEHDDGEPIQTYKDRVYSFGLEDTFKFSEYTRLIFGVSYDTKDGIKAQDYQQLSGSRIYGIYNFDTQKEHAFNYQVQLRHSFDGSDELELSYAKKTYFPSMKERYTRSIRRDKEPNPWLKPEIANHYEISYGRNFMDNLRIESAVFYSNIKDAIGEVYISQTKTQNQNIDKARYFGTELTTTYKFSQMLDFGGNYTYINAKYKNKDDKITDLAKHKGFIWADFKFMPKFSIYISQELSSGTYSDIGNKNYIKNPGFGVTNLKLSYLPTSNLSFDVGISNLFDKNYSYSEGYPEDGRLFFSNIRYKF